MISMSFFVASSARRRRPGPPAGRIDLTGGVVVELCQGTGSVSRTFEEFLRCRTITVDFDERWAAGHLPQHREDQGGRAVPGVVLTAMHGVQHGQY